MSDALARRRGFETPFRHWIVDRLLPESLPPQLAALDFPAPDPGGVWGRREYHNDARSYFDAGVIAKHPAAAAVAEAFQASGAVAAISSVFGADLDGTCLRIEYAQDVDGFWLEPHTDLGVKKLTILYALPGGEHEALGTDLYDGQRRWAKRIPFAPNAALVFVPDDDTWHGFDRRPIKGVRKSLIINYVASEWRAREQLCFPEKAVHGSLLS